MKPKKAVAKVSCAIYTRTSTDENLDQEFNSLHAQREACESFISSQRSEGWLGLQDQYDDGGFSGGNLNRPALNRLLKDIESGKVNVVVVYKIDRLSRSLIDFTKLVEIFDRHGVSFVSVTQSFNTTNSMGRLTLNILLSFAQFERENSAERVRDKVAASRKKGIWMGGFPPLGYDIANRRLLVNKKEANLVQHIFQRFSELGSGTLLIEELNKAGYKTKTWTSISSGTLHKGRSFDKGVLYRILNNRVYLGEAVHKGKSYPGEHDGIINKRLWDKVHSIISSDSRKRGNVTRAETPALLKGIIYCRHCRRAMTTSHTRKNGGKQYRYYLCMNASKNRYDHCPVGMISAGEMEAIVFDQIQKLLRSPEVVMGVWNKSEGVKEREITKALRNIDPVWEELFPREQARVIQLLVSRVEVSSEILEVHLRLEGFESLVQELGEAA
jgi:site-specific DNA recombinase